MSSKFAVCVVDDDADFRNAIKLLCKSKNIPFLGFASSAEFFEGYDQKNVGCILLDLQMGTKDEGIKALEEMRNRDIHIPVVLSTGHAKVDVSVQAMKLGAVDVLQKPAGDAEILQVVQNAFAKAENLRKFQSERKAVKPRVDSLTPREIEVLDLMVMGKKNRKIAEELGISTKTLDIHRANIMRKMQTKTVADLVRWRLVNRADTSGMIPVIVRA